MNYPQVTGKFETYVIPAFYASYAYYGEVGDLTEAEIGEYDSFIQENNLAECVNIDDTNIHTRFADVQFGTLCECHDFTFRVKE